MESGLIIGKMEIKKQREYLKMGMDLQVELEETLGDKGVILHPPYNRPAPAHWDPFRTPFACAYTAIFNVMENPATCLPVAWTDRSLPVSIQVVAAPGLDRLTVAVAAALEADFGGWRRAPVV